MGNKYLFNGKEMQIEFDLGWLDFHARQYDPSLGRMLSIDPMAEMMVEWNPYHYTYNYPILFNDPSGMLPKYNWDTGEYEDDDGNVVSWQQTQAVASTPSESLFFRGL